MKPSNEPPDPLLQSLAEDAPDLPLRAALSAKERAAQRRHNRQSLAAAGAVCLLGLVAAILSPSQEAPPPVIAKHTPETAAPFATEEPDAPLVLHPPQVHPGPQPAAIAQELPSGLDSEQAALVKAAGSLPLVLVRDESGKVTRIHMVQR